MKPAASMLGIAILVLAAVVIGHALQVAPSPGSIKLFERFGGTANDGASPMVDAGWTASVRAANNGVSVRLFSSVPAGQQTWTVTYVLRCGGTMKGSGSGTVTSWYDGTKIPLWFTIPNTQDRPAVEVGDGCYVTLTVSGTGLSWRTGTTGGIPDNRHDVVVWGLELALDEEPPPPPPPPPPGATPPPLPPEESPPPPPGELPWLWILAGVLVAVGVMLILLALFRGG